MASHFEKDEKFSKKIGEDVKEFIKNYLEAAIDYRFNPEQKLRIFQNLFEGKAELFCRNTV